jgi:hypothetical protein
MNNITRRHARYRSAGILPAFFRATTPSVATKIQPPIKYSFACTGADIAKNSAQQFHRRNFQIRAAKNNFSQSFQQLC